jgi:hypothetical protein
VEIGGLLLAALWAAQFLVRCSTQLELLELAPQLRLHLVQVQLVVLLEA